MANLQMSQIWNKTGLCLAIQKNSLIRGQENISRRNILAKIQGYRPVFFPVSFLISASKVLMMDDGKTW